MTYRGHVKNGVIVLDEANASLPEGSAVDIVPVLDQSAVERPEELRTLYEILKPFVGVIDDLPPDMSINHDHYLYGAPKKTP